MCDSDDDYFADELVLDDKTLAVLDEEESKFKRTTNTQTQQSHGVGPPPKRQKTTGSWQPQSIGKTLPRADTLEDMDDLPDVSVRQDGTYGLQDKQRRPSGPPSRSGIIAPGPNVVAAAPGPTRPAPLSRGSAPHIPVRSVSVAGSVRAAQVAPRPPSSARGTRTVQSPVSSQAGSRPQSGPPQRVNRVPSTTVSGNYVEQLVQQIEEVWYLCSAWVCCVWIETRFLQLRKENQVIHADMASAMEAKFAKDGEVTILRKRLEKVHGTYFMWGYLITHSPFVQTAQEHLAQLAKLKSAKDEADAKHVLLQKQYEVDKERLKTELTFRVRAIYLLGTTDQMFSSAMSWRLLRANTLRFFHHPRTLFCKQRNPCPLRGRDQANGTLLALLGWRQKHLVAPALVLYQTSKSQRKSLRSR